MNKELLEALIQKTTHDIPFAIEQANNKDGRMIIEGERLLKKEKLITVQSDTGINYVPEHTHDYVEIVYMCQGSKTNIVNGETVLLKKGDILFLSQNCRQENLPSYRSDISVNFIVLPQFFERALEMMGTEDTLLHRFIIQCLKGDNGKSSYLHFKVADVLPIQNLAENLIWNLMSTTPDRRKINESTMGLLFLHLLDHIDRLEYNGESNSVIFRVLNYIEAHFADGSLSELAGELFYDFNALSRQIKKQTGKTYTELVQKKRLSQACFLLRSTKLTVADIAGTVGYGNISYFHRLFYKAYGISPKKYRDTFKY